MTNVTSINEVRRDITNLLEQLNLDNKENNLSCIAVAYMDNNGDVNYTWVTPSNTLKMVGGVNLLSTAMLEKCSDIN